VGLSAWCLAGWLLSGVDYELGISMGSDVIRMDSLRHIVQRQSNDCMIATAAMIAAVDYEVAAMQSPVSVGQRGLFPKEIISILESVTGVIWLGSTFRWWRPIEAVGSDVSPVVVTVRRPWRWRTLHCVAVYKGMFHDPEYHCGLSMNEYDRRRWRVVHSYSPESVDRLLEIRENRYRQDPECELPFHDE
jgi:hypothetical protein